MALNLSQRRDIRGQLRDVLAEYDLHLKALTWTEDLEKGELKLGLKISGELSQQIALPFTGEEEGE